MILLKPCLLHPCSFKYILCVRYLVPGWAFLCPITILNHTKLSSTPPSWIRELSLRQRLRRLQSSRSPVRRREHMVGVNMVGVNMAFHDAICECFEGTMLEPCLLKPCVHVAGSLQLPGLSDRICI